MDYNKTQLKKDIASVLQSQPGPLSGRYLGNPSNNSLYTTERISQLWEGICVAWVRFYRKEFPLLKEFARMVLCECAQESTMNYNLNVKPFDFNVHESMGIIQCTPGSVLKDFAKWGVPIKSVLRNRTNVVVADPKFALQFDLSNMCLSLTLWAWYTKNCVLMGVSMNEYAHRKAWNIETSKVTPIYGNCLLTWLAGPRNDISTNNGKASFQDYYNRICDYWTQSGFGDKQTFDAHISQRISSLSYLVKECIDGTASS